MGIILIFILLNRTDFDKKTTNSAITRGVFKTGVESNQKLYIIIHADRMTVNAANSLLKFLEEPHNQTYAILITEQLQRCYRRFYPVVKLLHLSRYQRRALLKSKLNAGVNQKRPH